MEQTTKTQQYAVRAEQSGPEQIPLRLEIPFPVLQEKQDTFDDYNSGALRGYKIPLTIAMDKLRELGIPIPQPNRFQ
ncbi:hypothetical protein CMI37_10340 [Candidatus Pacearchaeota archaeon]|nr:hypothetical protein [Candidatus Pacearchaeota archaeon]|tara:strand:+ start:2287 stop:2517 length:231 start_codon:yes stop_codon:yes gene_type:complete